MKPFLAMLITCACCLAVSADSPRFETLVGVVDANSEGRLCLSISNPRLAGGAEVSVVMPERPQRVVKATVEAKAADSCSRNPDSNASYYWLKLAAGVRAVNLGEPMPPAIAVVGSAGAVKVRRGIASGDLNGNGRAEFFRICTSTEGNHLTVWTGRPLRGRRVWHSYYYLGYDVVPDCKKRDFQ